MCHALVCPGAQALQVLLSDLLPFVHPANRHLGSFLLERALSGLEAEMGPRGPGNVRDLLGGTQAGVAQPVGAGFRVPGVSPGCRGRSLAPTWACRPASGVLLGFGGTTWATWVKGGWISRWEEAPDTLLARATVPVCAHAFPTLAYLVACATPPGPGGCSLE